MTEIQIYYIFIIYAISISQKYKKLPYFLILVLEIQNMNSKLRVLKRFYSTSVFTHSDRIYYKNALNSFGSVNFK